MAFAWSAWAGKDEIRESDTTVVARRFTGTSRPCFSVEHDRKMSRKEAFD
jgi:hypothetical protein